MSRGIALACITALLSGCATAPGTGSSYGANYEPIIDIRPGQSQDQYRNDLMACQGYATRVMSAGEGAVSGAIAGAVIGALIGAAAGGGSRFNSQMAGVGAVSGGVGGAAGAEMNQRTIIARCMTGRGYNVLN